MTFAEKFDFFISIEKQQTLTNKQLTQIEILSDDENDEIRMRTAEILVNFPLEKCEEILLKLTYDKDELVRVHSCDSLCVFNSRTAFDRLLEMSLKDKCLVRSYAVLSMTDITVNGKFNSDEIIQLFKYNFIKEKSTRVKLSYYYAFCVLGERSYYNFILHCLYDESYHIRCTTINLLLELMGKDDYEKTLQCFIECEKIEKTKAVRDSLAKGINFIKSKQ